MIETKTETIDGHEYDLTQLGALEGRRVWTRLMKLAGPAVQGLATSGLTEASIAGAIANALKELDDSMVEFLCDTFGRKTRLHVDGRLPELTGQVFDQHFAGRYASMMRWLFAHLRLNFADFLSVLQPDASPSGKAAASK